MALNFEQIYENSLVGDNPPPKGLFKKDYLIEFLALYGGEFLHSIQNPSIQKNWLIDNKTYKKLLLYYYKSSFSDFSSFFLRTYGSQNQEDNSLLLGFLDDLATNDSSNLLVFLKLISAKKIEFSVLEQKQYLVLFYLIHFFDLSIDEKEYYFKELETTLSEEFIRNKDLYFEMQEELDCLEKEEIYEPLLELLKCIVSQNKEAIDKSYLNFLLSYHNFSSGLSRSFTKFQKVHTNSYRLLKKSYAEGSLSVNWQYFNQVPQEQELRNLLKFLKDRARKTFFRDFFVAMVLTILFSYIFEPQHLVFWITVCVIANICEYYFAHFKINKIYYMYRLKTPCRSYMSNLHPLLLYMDFEGVELKDPYEIQLLNGLRKDPWLYLPIRL
jgi:hypothetical protein